MHNIILFATADYPGADAPGQRASLIVKGLRAAGEYAALVIPHASRIGNVAGNTRPRGHSNGVPFLYLNGRTSRPLNSFAALIDTLRGFSAGVRLLFRRKRLRRLDAVILYSPDSLEYLPIILACLLLRVPFFVEICEMMTTMSDRLTWKQRLRMVGYFITERFIPHLARGYIVISTSLHAHYARYMSTRAIHVLPILVDDPQHAVAEPSGRFPGKKVILYSGSFGEKDGVPYLIRAFKVVHDTVPKSHFILTGRSADDSTMQSLADLARELGIDGAMEFVGFVPRAKLDSLQREARVLLVCRTRSEFARHGFPWKLGEYCLVGNPIVATNIGDIAKYFEDHKSIFFAEPEDADSIGSTILYVLTHEDESLHVSAAQRSVALNNFDYRKRGSALSSFIHTCLSHPT